MADKTAISDKKFTLVLSDGTKVPELRTRSTYELGNDGVVRDARVDLLKLITKTEYDALPDNVKIDRDVQINPTSGTITEYYAILASRPPGRGSNFTYNTNVLNAISIKDGTANRNPLVPVGPNLTFKKDAAEYNNSGGRDSPFKTVTSNASKAILKKEGIRGGSAKDQTGLGANTPDGSDADRNTNATLTAIPIANIQGKNPVQQEFGGKSNLRYPLNISDKQDSIMFTALEYKALDLRAGTQVGDLFNLSQKRQLTSIKTSVTLPIQSKISDINQVNWGLGEINPLQAFGLGFLSDPKGAFEATKNAILNNEGKSTFLGEVEDAGKVLAFQEALGITGLLSRTAGAVFNPNTELLFRGPQLRPFNFSFFLAARSDKEAKEIRTIIRYFKQNMAVRETNNNLFLKSPNVFKIKYVYGRTGGVHPGLNQIKECALKSFNVDYNPDNSYMTFEDGTMTAYRITMQFQELLPITDTDYFENNQYSTGPLADPDEVDFSPAIPDDHIGF
jgi:hypothetical protein